MNRATSLVKKSIWLVVALLLFLYPVAFADQLHTGDFYLEEYGSAPESHPAVQEARNIFKKLVNSSYPFQSFNPKLIILPENAALWLNWATSLPDGSVVLVKNVLDLCFDQAGITEKGRARLAFILAHELAHLRNNDFDRIKNLGELGFEGNLSSSHTQKISKMESQADYFGLILMTMADFEPVYLIDQSNFFQEYIEKTQAHIADQTHSAPEARKTELLNQMQPLIRQLPLFSNGIRLYRQKKYKSALESFQNFAAFFPGREVYNNIGLVYFQLALQNLAVIRPEKPARFILATEIDPETLAQRLIPQSKGEPRGYSEDYQRYLKSAAEHFNLAIQKDPNYLPARLNLSSTLIIMEDFPQALETAGQALVLDPDNLSAACNKAVASYLADPEKNNEAALGLLDNVRDNSTGATQLNALYNSTRIRTEQNKCQLVVNGTFDQPCLTLARKSWSPFLIADNSSPYSKIVRNELGLETRSLAPLTEKNRIALVIGNSSYPDSPLLNPINDAASIQEALESMGFEVDLGINLSRDEMLEKIQLFGQRLTPASTGLFYYSGHGLQIQGENVLVPVDVNTQNTLKTAAPAEQEALIRNMTVSIQLLIDQLKNAGNLRNIIILDACRNNPLPGLAGDYLGLAEMNAPPGTYIAYSTSPGKLAWDGTDGKYGVFTSALLQYMNQPNLSVNDLFQRVRRDVKNKTNDSQITWDTSTLDDQYFLNPPKPQNWNWHITAGVLALTSAWLSRQEAKSYRDLNEENKDLMKKNSEPLSIDDLYQTRSTYQLNQQKMQEHKRNFEVLDVITIGALAWELYLLVYKTYSEGIYPDKPEKSSEPITFTPNVQNGFYRLEFSWKW